MQQFERFFAAGPHEPVDYLAVFLPLVGSAMRLPDRLPPALEQGARAAMAERPPGQAVIPLDELRGDAVPEARRLRRHNAAFEAVCDVLEASSAPSARCSPARATRCRGSASRSTACWRASWTRAEAQTARAAPPPISYLGAGALAVRAGPPFWRRNTGRAVGNGPPVSGSISRVSPVAISTQPRASIAFVK